MPFLWDAATLERGINFTLKTQLGDLDLLGEVSGGGYEDLAHAADAIEIAGNTYLVQLKRAAGRPKNLESIAELEVLREEKELRDTEIGRRQPK